MQLLASKAFTASQTDDPDFVLSVIANFEKMAPELKNLVLYKTEYGIEIASRRVDQ
jgi:hypothetical protein